MFIFPIGDDNPSRRVPYVTYGLIGLNAIVFFLANGLGGLPNEVAREWGLVPAKAEAHTFITSMFLHGNLLHIIGNMVFLWIAGDNVEDKFGHIGYLVFYLASGLFADVTYMAFTSGNSTIPLVGASGAIAGVLGAYMMLFPKARIRLFLWLWIFIQVVRIEARWFLGFWVAQNLFNWLVMSNSHMTGVAYAAHVGGFVVGVFVAWFLKDWLRNRGGASRVDHLTGFSPPPGAGRRDPPRSARPTRPGRPSRPAPVIDAERVERPRFVSPRTETRRGDEGFFGLEEAIAENVKTGRIDAALSRYEEYLGMQHAKPLPGWAQIEIAGELFRRSDYEASLRAYRRYLSTHATGPDAAEAKFRLGVILSRHRKEYFRAREYLLQATMEHPDPEIVAYAKKELDRVSKLI